MSSATRQAVKKNIYIWQVEQLGDECEGRTQLPQGQTVEVSNMTVIYYWSALLLKRTHAERLVIAEQTQIRHKINPTLFYN